MKILIFDQSTAVLGISYFEEDKLVSYGKIKIPKADNINFKIHNIKNIIKTKYNELKPDVIIFEDVQQQASVNVYKVLSQLLAVIIDLCIENNIVYHTVYAKTWKSHCGIKGKKREEQKINTIAHIKEKFGLEVSEDEADSICMGLWATANIKSTG